MSATTTTCPSWCVEHIAPEGDVWTDDSPLHLGPDVTGETTEGRWRIGFSVDDSEPATLSGDADGQMTPAQARAFASAIAAACDLIEGTPVAAL